MFRKFASLACSFVVLFAVVFNASFSAPAGHAVVESLTSEESQVVALVNGTSVYNYDLELEGIGLDPEVSNFSFRSGGSLGATATAMWLLDEFDSFGLQAVLEPFTFVNWNLSRQPQLVIDEDDDINTPGDQILISPFQSEHYSWPTGDDGVFADLVVLPLPTAENYSEIGVSAIDTAAWGAINTTGKIVLIGREVRWNGGWEGVYHSKLSQQKPAAVIYTWWYPWMAFAPPFFSSLGGRPTGSFGPYYWNLQIPVGWVNHGDGMVILDRENAVDVSAKVTIPAVIGSGTHYNAVGKLQGSKDPEKMIIVSGHYDTVVTAGFADNGAGTAGVLELARVFSEAAANGLYSPDYTLVFVAFASEELGLIGSMHYLQAHSADMRNVVAVINLDCIGSDELSVARTDPSAGFDLDELIAKAADDLGVSASFTDLGGSDQEVFRNPRGAEGIFAAWWPDVNQGVFRVGGATPVEASSMLISFPLFYSDEWNRGSPGWIHTSYDNSTSTQTLDWVEIDRLEEQVKVAALSVMRILSSGSPGSSEVPPFPWWIVGVAAAGIVVAVVTILYVVRFRKRSDKGGLQRTDWKKSDESSSLNPV